MQTKKIVIASLFVMLMSILFVIFPSSPFSTYHVVKATGTVEAVYVAGEADLVLKLKDDEHLYYLTQGDLKKEVPLETLKQTFSQQPVEILYVTNSRFSTTISKRKQIAKVTSGSIELFSQGNVELMP